LAKLHKRIQPTIKEIVRDDQQDFFVTEFEDKDGELVFKDDLHNNWMEIYSAAYRLKVKSIFECGFGGCYHLKNMHTILPDAKISGCDLLQTQMNFGVEFSKIPDSITENMKVMDFTQTSLKYDVGQHEFVYSQAVIMHLSTENGRQFLRNMGKLSSKYIMFTEGYRNHENFFDMIKECLPDFEFSVVDKYVPSCIDVDKSGKDNFTCAILLTRK